MKFSIYLNRHVFVMYSYNIGSTSLPFLILLIRTLLKNVKIEELLVSIQYFIPKGPQSVFTIYLFFFFNSQQYSGEFKLYLISANQNFCFPFLEMVQTITISVVETIDCA